MPARTNNTWILTHSWQKFSLTKPGTPRISDIAYALSHLNRFTGHVGRYSVAEHCVHVWRRVRDLGGSLEEQLAALLHDATEAYVGDASSPLKQAMRLPAWSVSDYDRVEANVWRAIAEAFGIPFDLPPIVKRADHELVRIEAEHLWGGKLPADWGPLVPPFPGMERYAPLRWPPAIAEARYLAVFGELVLALEGAPAVLEAAC